MRAAILLFALGVVAFVNGEAEEDPPTKVSKCLFIYFPTLILNFQEFFTGVRE